MASSISLAGIPGLSAEAICSAPVSTNTTVGNCFTFFPKLPLELRQKIWDDTLPRQRVVTVFYQRQRDIYTSSALIPAALQACKESRKQALRVYQLRFASYSGEARVFFSFDRDVLHIDVTGIADKRFLPVSPRLGYISDFTANTTDITKVQFLCGLISTLYLLIKIYSVYVPLIEDFTALKMFVEARCPIHNPTPRSDPVARIIVQVPIRTYRHPYSSVRMAEEVYGVKVAQGVVSNRDDDECGLDLSMFVE